MFLNFVFFSPSLIMIYEAFFTELRVVHELNQATKGDNPCDKLNCHGLCLFKPFKTGVQATCACPEEYTLAADGRTCLSNCNAL